MRVTAPPSSTPSRSLAIQATNLVKSFVTGQEIVRAVRGVSLDVYKGEVVNLEGPSGSGKTTLLCILGCMLTPDSGSLVIDGRVVDPRKPERLPEFRRNSIGFVFQQFNLFPALTARENILYALKIKGVTGRKARLEATRMIDAVGLSGRQQARPRELSGGQKQRVAIARALAGPATILLADEPTANLDAQTGIQILDIFRELAQSENRAVVIVTHDPKVRRIADRVCTIHDGLLTELDPDQFQESAHPEPQPPPQGPTFAEDPSLHGPNDEHRRSSADSSPAASPRRYPTTLAFRNRGFYSQWSNVHPGFPVTDRGIETLGATVDEPISPPPPPEQPLTSSPLGTNGVAKAGDRIESSLEHSYSGEYSAHAFGAKS